MQKIDLFLPIYLLLLLFVTCQNKPSADAPSATPQEMRVTAKPNLRMRNAPSLKAPSIKPYPDFGERVQVLELVGPSETIDGRNARWAKVRFRGVEGYIFSAYLEPISSSTGEASDPFLSRDGFELGIWSGPESQIEFLARGNYVHSPGLAGGIYCRGHYTRSNTFLYLGKCTHSERNLIDPQTCSIEPDPDDLFSRFKLTCGNVSLRSSGYPVEPGSVRLAAGHAVIVITGTFQSQEPLTLKELPFAESPPVKFHHSTPTGDTEVTDIILSAQKIKCVARSKNPLPGQPPRYWYYLGALESGPSYEVYRYGWALLPSQECD